MRHLKKPDIYTEIFKLKTKKNKSSSSEPARHRACIWRHLRHEGKNDARMNCRLLRVPDVVFLSSAVVAHSSSHSQGVQACKASSLWSQELPLQAFSSFDRYRIPIRRSPCAGPTIPSRWRCWGGLSRSNCPTGGEIMSKCHFEEIF